MLDTIITFIYSKTLMSYYLWTITRSIKINMGRNGLENLTFCKVKDHKRHTEIPLIMQQKLSSYLMRKYLSGIPMTPGNIR